MHSISVKGHCSQRQGSECSVIWMEKVAGERGSFRPILGHPTPLLHAREWILRWIKMDISSAVEHSNPEAKATKMVAR